MFDIARELSKLPHEPGVYLMHHEDEIIYVGKARDLHNRVRQYFQSSRGKTAKILKMVSLVTEFEYIVTSSETEALVLENNLIKKHNPPYNTMLKDDKRYPYIKLTLHEPFPRILSTRQFRPDGSRYFGPFPNAAAVVQTIELIRNVLGLRTCSRRLPQEMGKERPCIYYDIGKCQGPCRKEIDAAAYQKAVREAVDLIGGKTTAITKRLESDMKAASEAMDFEKAAALRDSLYAVKALHIDQKVENAAAPSDRDVIAMTRKEDTALVLIFFVRGGKMIGREHFLVHVDPEEADSALFETILAQLYAETPYIPPEIVLNVMPDNADVLLSFLAQKAGRKVSLIVPKRGEKHHCLELAEKNAALLYSQVGERLVREDRRTRGACDDLIDVLGLERETDLPFRIEAYDISNTYGMLSVGSMVVFTDGKPNHHDYRKFRIKTVVGADDYKSLAEVLRRRFEHAIAELGTGSRKFTILPDLILMDGGKGQAAVAEAVLRELGLPIPVAGMVKDDTHATRGLYYEGQELAIDTHSEAFHLVTRIQDEAHRFAIIYHKQLRQKDMMSSVLDDVPDIGPARKKALLAAFGSVEAMKQKSAEELAAVPQMNAKAAASLFAFFHPQLDF